MAVTFNPQMLHSFEACKVFFRGDTEVQQIAAADTEAFCSCMQVAWLVVTAPFGLILFIFLSCITPLLQCVGATNLATRCEILSFHLVQNARTLEALMEHGQDLIAPIFGHYSLSASDVYLQPPLATNTLHDVPQIYAAVKDWAELHFYQREGVCHGLTSWFTYLYLHTQAFMWADQEEHLLAVSSLFYYGASNKAALLQAMCQPEENLLGIHRTMLIDRLPLAQEAELTQRLRDLEAGVYEVWVPRHRLAYIKIDQNRGYIVNPSVGVIRMHGLDSVAQVADYLGRYETSLPLQNFICLFRNTLASTHDLQG